MANLNPQATGSFSGHILSYIESRFYDFLKKELRLVPLGMSKVLGQNSGSTVKWNQWNVISANTTALTEGVSPDGQSISSNPYTATVAGYGQFVTVTDFLDMIAINDTMKDAQELLSYAGALTLDTLVRNELDANGTQGYTDPTNNTTKANVESGTDVIASADLRLVLKRFRKADVRPFENGLFKGTIHPLMEFDLLAESAANGFIVLSSYNGSATDAIQQAKIGTAFGLELSRSTNIRADATSTHTYGNIFVGKDAFGVVDLASAGMKMIVKPHGSSGVEDPLDQRATVGYKVYFATKILETVRTQVLWAYNAG